MDGTKNGIAMIFISMGMLTVAILAFITLNGWGGWIADYPNTLSISALPEEAQAQAGVFMNVYKIFFGPLLGQVGGYVQVMGNFAGTLLTCISLGLFIRGVTTIRNA